MIDWTNPYYVPVPVAVRLSAHAKGHIYYMVREGQISAMYLNESQDAMGLVVSLRDLLIWERDRNRRGQDSVVQILESLQNANVYVAGEDDYEVLNVYRAKGLAGRLAKNMEREDDRN